MNVRQIIGDKMPDIRHANENFRPRVALLSVVDSNQIETVKSWIAALQHQAFCSFEVCVVLATPDEAIGELLTSTAAADDRFLVYKPEQIPEQIALLYYCAYQMASAEYIMFLPPVVILQPNAIDDLRTYAICREQKIVFGNISCWDENVPGQRRICGGATTNIQDLRCLNLIPDGAMMMHRSVIEESGFLSPHVVIQGSCFHEFYYRLSRQHVISNSGVFLGEGVLPNATTGHYGLALGRNEEAWLFSEYITLGFSSKLDDYLSLDVYAVPANASKRFYSAVRHSRSCPEGVAAGKSQGMEKKSVMVLVPLMFASNTLYFERVELPWEQYVIRFVKYADYHASDFHGCDALINIRGLYDVRHVINTANECGIPCYYFIDDNFLEIHNEHAELAIFNDYTVPLVQKELANYKGVLCSTKALVDYYLAKKLHSTVCLFEPIMDSWRSQNSRPDIITISCMSGMARREQLEKSIVPALHSLVEDTGIPIRFVCPSYVNTEKYSSPLFEVYRVPFQESLDQIIKEFGRYHIHINLHAGVDTANNVYKTTNALMNAVQNGAALIACNCEPFTRLPSSKRVCLLADDSVESWKKEILSLIKNENLRKTLLRNAEAYCNEHFSGKAGSQILQTLLKQHCGKTDYSRLPPDLPTIHQLPSDSAFTPKEEPCIISASVDDNMSDATQMSPFGSAMWADTADLPEINLPLLLHYYHQALFTACSIHAAGVFSSGSFHLAECGTTISTITLALAKYGRDIDAVLRLRIYVRGQLTRIATAATANVPDNGLLLFRFEPLALPQDKCVRCKIDVLSPAGRVISDLSKEISLGLYTYHESVVHRVARKLIPSIDRPLFYLLQ